MEPERRAFAPHVTLARLPRGLSIDRPEVAAWRARHAALASEPFGFESVALYRSHLGHAGARYEPVLETPFGPA